MGNACEYRDRSTLGQMSHLGCATKPAEPNPLTSLGPLGKVQTVLISHEWNGFSTHVKGRRTDICKTR